VKDRFDVVVVGSGAGGGVIAGELAQRGRDVLLLECGPHLRAADFTRWESKAAHELFWPLRFAPLPNGELVTFLAGRCVGGTTTINTKVAFRAHERDVAKWHPASGLTSDGSEPFSVSDLEPYYDRVEQVLGVRERSDWEKSVYTAEAGFRALGAELEAIAAYQVGAESGLLQKPVLDLAVSFQSHHKEHADVLAKTIAKLGGKPVIAKSKYTFPTDTLKTQNDVLRFAATLEKGAVSAYLGAVPVFGNRDLAKAAASILGDEAMHWAILRNAVGEAPVPAAFVS